MRKKSKNSGLRSFMNLVVPPARFQRATSRLGGERSMQLSYGSTLTGSPREIVSQSYIFISRGKW